MVVQSAEAAEELFRKCDIPFADRTVPQAVNSFEYLDGSIALGRYSPYWRNMRRIISIEFLVQKKINDTMPIRQKMMQKLIARIKEEWKKSVENGGTGEVDLSRLLFYTAFDTVGYLTLSEEVMQTKLDQVGDFFEALLKFMEWLGKPNLSDCFPILSWVDPQGIRRNTKKYLGKLLGFTSEIVRERIKQRQSGVGTRRNDLLDAMLDEGDTDSNDTRKSSVKNIAIALLVNLR